MRKGSVTVFLALVSVLVLSFLFSLLEGARLYCLKSRAQAVTELCMQSMFGNYHTGIWEDYHLLFLDGSWQEGEFSMEKFIQRAMVGTAENLSVPVESLWEKSWDLTSLTTEMIQIDNFELATDGDGKAFLHQVALQMKLEAAADVLDELLAAQEQGSGIRERQKQKDMQWEKSWEAIKQAEEEAKRQENSMADEGSNQEVQSGIADGSGNPGGESGGAKPLENPMDYVKELKKSSVLSMVVTDPSEISPKALEDIDFLEDRQIQTGNWEQRKTDMSDRLLLQYYIQDYFSDYTRESEKGAAQKALDYEMEYLLGGKEVDSENLEKVVFELLGVREALNFVTIMQDVEKKELALGIATAAVGFTGLLPLVKAVQLGVLLAWAFVESVLDVRTLLEGKKVPFLKATGQWDSDLTDCRKTVESHGKSEDGGDGLSYTQYLQMLLFGLSEKTVASRCMELIEQTEQVRMDDMLQSVRGAFFYQARPLFWNLNVLSRQSLDSFVLEMSQSMTYGNR